MTKNQKNKNKLWKKIKIRQEALLNRRVHRSFKLTRRRDYAVRLPMPGYTSFTVDVFKFFAKNKNIFLRLVLIGCLLALMTASFMSQDSYLELVAKLRDIVQASSGEPMTLVGEAGTVFLSLIFGGLSSDDAANPFFIIAIVLIWLTSVWLVRHITAGKKVTLRQALYNSGAPIVGSGALLMLAVMQAAPAILAVGIYAIVEQNGFMSQGVVAMTVSLGLLGMTLISLYWLTSTLIALIIITLPNMYPMRAIRLAGDLVSGIRLRILYRFLWLAFVLGIIWLIVLGLSVTLDIVLRNWFDWFMNVPLVPMTAMVLMVFSIVFACIYIYLLYIKLVEARHERIR